MRPSLSAHRAAEPRGRVGGRSALLLGLGLALLLLVGGFFGYRYFKPAGTEQINSIAVLPFENRSGNADTDYLSDGLADPLIYRLSQLPNINKAMEQFKFATDRDPNYALAFVGLADCYTVSNEYTGTPTSETLPKAKAYAERALAIDPQLAEPHATLGSVKDYSWQ
jgi:tetratricopeptide (TPR) repeat protein